MRGSDNRSGSLFSYVDLEARVRSDHPLRRIKVFADDALEGLSKDFSRLYSGMGRPSIPPEMLLRAMLLQAFYSIRSERQLMERLEFDLLFRWFVGLGIDETAWDHSSFSKNRDRLLEGEIAAKFLAAVLAQPNVKRLLSSDHFSVDGTLIEAWASMKSFRPKAGNGEGGPPADPPASGGRNGEVDFKGHKRSNETHQSTTDPHARLYRKGSGMEAKLCFIGHALMENRSGLVVDTRLTQADGHGERRAALSMIEPRADRPHAISLGADKAYDAEDFVNELRSMNVRPHVTQNDNGRRSAIDRRTTRHASYAMSQKIRKRIEEAFGWIKTVAGQRKTRFKGRDRVGWAFAFAAAAYNLVRLPKLVGAQP
ncbi:IS5/IS1182 family transposase [Labrys okinawensis]|uniref:IS5/IS1182 family transposase n=1 Tax=Labrys okinawensis TaxID=346911 RepID=A0A2S9Q4S9_9HYPH|nr:IS5 family transposase [Labrys okinawensis]PRH84351.1 IS5/IS1182 family transposase [Labrys okinawensis]